MEIEPVGFIAATSIVAGILVVWAQLWVSTADQYASRKQSTRTAEIGLAVCYLGALASLAALTIAILSSIKGNKEIPNLALGLFIFALFLTFLEILGSLSSATLRLRDEHISGPPECAVKALRPKWVRCLLIALFSLAGLGVLCLLGIGIYAIFHI